MSQPNPSIAMARAVIDELARSSVRLAVVSPGSRSASLVIAASEHGEIEVATSIDERSGGFHALGYAKATGSPAALICTSGTAPANYLPAVIEAEMSLTPLVVISADRPTELLGVGANQAIDQINLFGGHVRLFTNVEAPDSAEDANERWRSAASRTVSAALGPKPGPSHLNLAFREPTVAATDDGRTHADVYPFAIEGRSDGEPWMASSSEPRGAAGFAESAPSRGVVIAGEGSYDREGLLAAAGAFGWPVLATAMSGMRGSGTLNRYHHVLAGGVPKALRPEIVYAVGAIGPSPRLEGLIASAPIRVRVDYHGRHIDPNRNATHVLHADPASTLWAMALDAEVDGVWSSRWFEANKAVESYINEYLAGPELSSGASVARALDGVRWDTLVVASSLPIREIDAHLSRSGQVIANRGASGIDGFISTALGVARASGGTVALSGDLSLLHDSNGFLIDPRPDLLLVVLDNDGGGLFDGLPVARHAPDYDRFFATPHGRDFEQLAGFHSLRYEAVTTSGDLIAAVGAHEASGGVSLIRVPIDRQIDLETRSELDRLAAGAISAVDI